jgi:hypothetical protein
MLFRITWITKAFTALTVLDLVTPTAARTG